MRDFLCINRVLIVINVCQLVQLIIINVRLYCEYLRQNGNYRMVTLLLSGILIDRMPLI